MRNCLYSSFDSRSSSFPFLVPPRHAGIDDVLRTAAERSVIFNGGCHAS
jgi:hypothetical protein